MPRPPRLLLSQSFYHIITRGNNRHTVFESDNDYLYYLDLLRKYKVDHPFNLYHYCLMPNHVHLQIQTKDASSFAIFMKRLNLAYFCHYHREYGWIGHFWQDRYKSQPIGKDAYFIQVGRYIEQNPVRAQIVEDPKDYSWSSYRFYALGETNDLITEDIFYQNLGQDNIQRQKIYQDMVIEDVIINSYSKRVWGSDVQRYSEQQKSNRRLLKIIRKKERENNKKAES